MTVRKMDTLSKTHAYMVTKKSQKDIFHDLLTMTSHPHYDILSMIEMESEYDHTIEKSYDYLYRLDGLDWIKHLISEQTYTSLRKLTNQSTFHLETRDISFRLYNRYYDIHGELLFSSYPDERTRISVHLKHVEFRDALSKLPNMISQKILQYIQSRILHDVSITCEGIVVQE